VGFLRARLPDGCHAHTSRRLGQSTEWYHRLGWACACRGGSGHAHARRRRELREPADFRRVWAWHPKNRTTPHGTQEFNPGKVLLPASAGNPALCRKQRDNDEPALREMQRAKSINESLSTSKSISHVKLSNVRPLDNSAILHIDLSLNSVLAWFLNQRLVFDANAEVRAKRQLTSGGLRCLSSQPNEIKSISNSGDSA
jgi:hypothetical protein